MSDELPVAARIQEERRQAHSTRQALYAALRTMLGQPVISLVTSFKYHVMLEDGDADALEGILQKSDISKGFILLLSSPGGDGLAAERIINI